MSGTTGIQIGIDIGGTSIKAVRLSANGADREQLTVPAGGALDKDATLAILRDTLRLLAPKDTVGHVGIAVGGLIGADGTMPADATNLPHLAGGPLAPMFSAHLGLPCSVINDAHAAMHGEAWVGAAQGLTDVMMVTLGTGIGGGLMLGGHVRRGAHGSAGEIGTWAMAGEPSFETLASPANFERRTGRRLGDAIIANGDSPDVATVFDAIGRHLAAVHTLLDLEAIVIGGSIAAVGEPIRTGIEAAIRRHCPAPLLHDLKVVTSTLGPYAGAIGAVAPSVRGANP